MRGGRPGRVARGRRSRCRLRFCRSPAPDCFPKTSISADGLTEEVTTALAKVNALRVTSRRSAAAFRTANAAGGRRRGATACPLPRGRKGPAGPVPVSGCPLNSSMRGMTSTVGQASTMARSDDVFLIQQQMARKIVEALELRLSAAEEIRLGERTIDDAGRIRMLPSRGATICGAGTATPSIAPCSCCARRFRSPGRMHSCMPRLGLAHLQYREAGIDLSEGPLLEADACACKLLRARRSFGCGMATAGLDRVLTLPHTRRSCAS